MKRMLISPLVVCAILGKHLSTRSLAVLSVRKVDMRILYSICRSGCVGSISLVRGIAVLLC